MVLLMRHGESTWNAAGRLQWQNPQPPLTPRGREQVSGAAQQLLGLVTSIVTSPAVRAAQSAAIVGERLGLVPVEDARLVELGREESVEQLTARVAEVIQADVDPQRLVVTHGDVIAHAARWFAAVPLGVPANASVIRLTPAETGRRWALDALL